MLLGTAAWPEGPGERRALVGRLASGRLADLNRIEAIRLRKLGEGDPDRLADALVPSSLRRLLEGGPRALSRAKQTLAYAEKWDRRGTLPASLAPLPDAADLLPCLPRPSALHRADGTALDRLAVRGPGVEIGELPRPGLAVLGQAGGGVAGFCLALEEGGSALLGAWMVDAWPEGDLELRAGAARRGTSLGAWEEVALPVLRPGEVLLLPVPKLKPLQELLPGAEVRVATAFETMVLRAGPEGIHPTVH
ncbi:hypothetical protein [Geothrix fermentans]|uniref:hypothetical protein n=1 Tax=Geothrix fermentans TaxID=44676 RepID=UPI0003F6C7FB|nr:hypothetical protein [Geothrix fermentans]